MSTTEDTDAVAVGDGAAAGRPSPLAAPAVAVFWPAGAVAPLGVGLIPPPIEEARAALLATARPTPNPHGRCRCGRCGAAIGGGDGSRGLGGLARDKRTLLCVSCWQEVYQR